jgi:general secretion pathway protein C
MMLTQFHPQALLDIARLHQHRLRLIVIILLSLYLIAFAAKLTWRIIPEPKQSSTATQGRNSSSTATASQRGVDVNQIQRLALFGNAAAKPEDAAKLAVKDAPETRLNLTLTGAVTSSEANGGAAIIENKGRQNTYGIGEKIEGTNATLEQVQFDRVIIKNSGRHETLMLDGIDFNKDKSKPKTATVRQPSRRSSNEPRRARVRKVNEQAAEQLRDKPGSFTDFFSISPYSEDGKIVGYNVKPGKKPDLFESAGLNNGDIVVQINGLDVTDPQQATEAMGTLRSAQSIELTVTRDGEYMTLYLDMPEPDSGETN